MLLVNMLTLHYKVSQSVSIISHLFHCDFLVNVVLDSKAVNRIKEEKLAYFFKVGCGCVSNRNGPSSSVFSLHITNLPGINVKQWIIQHLILLFGTKHSLHIYVYNNSR